MRPRPFAVLALLLVVASLAPGPADAPRKKVLVELYTSQGCNSCPPANAFLGELEKLGYGPEKVVALGFHVDYFNTPWADPFSNKDYSRRELAYNAVKKRDDLYFTPMMMVDGRTPMLGSNRPEALSAIERSSKAKPGARLALAVRGEGADRTASVEVAPTAAEAAGHPLMVGLAVTDGPESTRVPSGENAGKTLVEYHVVRSFQFQRATLATGESKAFTFPIKLPDGVEPARARVAAWVQGWDDGLVHQADSVEWMPRAAASATR